MISLVPTGNLGGLNPSIVSVSPIAGSRISAGDLVMFDIFDTSAVTDTAQLVQFDDKRCPFNVVVRSPVDVPSASVWGVALSGAEIGQRVKVAVTGLVSATVYASEASLVAGASVGPDAVGGRLTQSRTSPSIGIFLGVVATPFTAGSVGIGSTSMGYVLFDGFAAIATGTAGSGLRGVSASGLSSQLNYLFNNESNVIEFAGTGSNCWGNVISGGGNSVNKNIIYGNTSLRTISGGYNNVIGVQGADNNDTIASTIAGGAHHRIGLNLDNTFNVVTPSGTIAPDHSTISGGSYNLIANGDYGTISGGTTNTLYETNATWSRGDYATIGGGTLNIASGNNSTIAGGNTNKVETSGGVIAGGNDNQIVGPAEGANVKNSAGIASGSSNVIRCSGQAVIAGGQANEIGGSLTSDLGSWCSISGGFQNTIGVANYAVFSAIAGGRNNKVEAQACLAAGHGAQALNTNGAFVFGGGTFANVGDAQSTVYVIKIETTNATATAMTSMGSSLFIPNDTTWAFKCLIVARNVNSSTESAAYEVTGCIDRESGGTVALVGTPTVTVIAEDVAAWNVAVSAGTNNLVINCTGEAAKTIRWVGRLELAEVTG